VHGCHGLEFNGTIATQSGIPWHDAAGACARTSPERRHAVPSKSRKKSKVGKSENRGEKVEIGLENDVTEFLFVASTGFPV
jgi:hypothetical protein